MPTILCDTSFLMYIVNNPSPLLRMVEERWGAYELLVPSPVLEELKRLAVKGDKRGREARNALNYAIRQLVVELGRGVVDEMLVKYAMANKCILATLDSKLLYRARRAGVAIITPRRGRLYFEGIGG